MHLYNLIIRTWWSIECVCVCVYSQDACKIFLHWVYNQLLIHHGYCMQEISINHKPSKDGSHCHQAKENPATMVVVGSSILQREPQGIFASRIKILDRRQTGRQWGECSWKGAKRFSSGVRGGRATEVCDSIELFVNARICGFDG